MSERGYEPVGPDDPRASRGDQRLWIIAGLLAVVAAVAVVLLIINLNDDESDDTVTTDTTLVGDTSSTTASTSTTDPAETSSTTASTTTTSEAATTTTAATTTSRPSETADPAQCKAAGGDPTNPDPVAQAVFQSWVRGDTACAAELMSEDSLQELFDRSGAGAQDVFQGCNESDSPDPAMDCAFTYEGGSTHFLMNFSPTEGWQIFDFYQIAD